MRILIPGGTSFVGHALTIAATSRGHEVTTFTRSSTPPGAAEGIVETIFGDRTKAGAYDFAADRQWDVVIDTWFGAPKVVHESAIRQDNQAVQSSKASTYKKYPRQLNRGYFSYFLLSDGS
jgi:2'-hydroxyisoflavone reductase